MTGKIHLKNMVFYGFHGNLPAENTLGQRFSIDLTLTLDMTDAARTDDLNATVDYTQIYALCREIMEKTRMKLLEALAGHILDRVLAAHPRITQADIIIRKPSVPIAGVLDYVAIETSKAR